MDNEAREKKFKFDWQRKILACRLGKNTTAVALALSIHANGDGTNAHPGIRLLAHEAEVSERMARAALERLRDLGLITRTKRGSTSKYRNWADVYALDLPDDLHERVSVEEKPSVEECRGQGQGGKANHVRWHERRGKTDPACIFCSEAAPTGPQEANSSGGEGWGERFPRGLPKPSGRVVESIRPPAKRNPTTGRSDADHRSVRTPHHAFTATPDIHHPASPVAGPRASSRAADERYKTFVSEQLADRIEPGDFVEAEEDDEMLEEIDFDYVVHVVGDLDTLEESTARGMLRNLHPCAVIREIRKMRGYAA